MGSQIYTRGPCAPRRPPSGKIFIAEKFTWHYLHSVKFQLSSSNTIRDTRGSQMSRWGVKFPLKLVPHFGVKVHAVFGMDRGGSLIVCDGGDCRCEVSLHTVNRKLHTMFNNSSISAVTVTNCSVSNFGSYTQRFNSTMFDRQLQR